MREVISINIGQAGLKVGNLQWELFCLEHNILPDGNKKESEGTDQPAVQSQSYETIFSCTGDGRYRPRCVNIDLEPTTMDEIRTSAFSQLYHPDSLISGKEGTAGNSARGHYTVGRELIDLCMDRIRRLADDCVGLQGFIICNSIGGGTGSGFGSLLLERLSVEYAKKQKVGLNIFPSSSHSTGIVEPYNCVFAAQTLLQHADASVVLDNEAISDICHNHLDINRPTYTNINNIITQATSSITASIRFDGALNSTLTEIQTISVPYPRIHFLLTSYAPFRSTERAAPSQISVSEITSSLFEQSHMLAKCDIRQGRYMACSVMYRGDVIPKNVSASIALLKTKRTVRFVDWSPAGFRAGINYEAPKVLPGGDLGVMTRSGLTILNTSAISQVFSRLAHKFDLLYSKRAFVHEYLREGGQQDDFTNAREELTALEKDYEQLAGNEVEGTTE